MVEIDINCDMGESFGNWEMGNDTDIMPYITSANIAAGYHAADPHVMRETVALAAEHDVGIGVHPGLPDKMGFGRRAMDATPDEVRDYVTYQLGALTAFAEQQGASVQHVKPHGAMYSMLSEDPELARAVMEGILAVDDDLVYLATDMNIYEVAQDVEGLRTVFEGYVDLDYRPDRSLIVEQSVENKDPRSSPIALSPSQPKASSRPQMARRSRDLQTASVSMETIHMPLTSLRQSMTASRNTISTSFPSTKSPD